MDCAKCYISSLDLIERMRETGMYNNMTPTLITIYFSGELV